MCVLSYSVNDMYQHSSRAAGIEAYADQHSPHMFKFTLSTPEQGQI